MSEPAGAIGVPTGTCAINDCAKPSAGVMEWPDIDTFVELCQGHANYVGAVERFIDGTEAGWDAADRMGRA